jgi:hypothetical protein
MFKKIVKTALFAVGVIVVTEAYNVAKVKYIHKLVAAFPPDMKKNIANKLAEHQTQGEKFVEMFADARRGTSPVPHQDVTS